MRRHYERCDQLMLKLMPFGSVREHPFVHFVAITNRLDSDTVPIYLVSYQGSDKKQNQKNVSMSGGRGSLWRLSRNIPVRKQLHGGQVGEWWWRAE